MTRTAVLGLMLCAGTASAGLTSETGQYAGSYTVDYTTGTTIDGDLGTRMTAVYDNISAPAAANVAFSSTDLNSTWGDTLGTLGTGNLQEFGFTVFNSGSSAGALLTAGFEILFFRAGDSSFIGGFTTSVSFGAGLNAGFFSTVNVTGLEGLGINLDTTNLIVTQRRTASTGAANRLGFVSLNPLLAGTSSPSTFYASSTTVGPAGFYNLNPAGTQTNPGYRLVVPTPATAALLGLSGLVATRRRR